MDAVDKQKTNFQMKWSKESHSELNAKSDLLKGIKLF